MKIGIIGAGNIGGTLGQLWSEAGYEILLSSRHPDELSGLVRELGENARGGSIEEAAQFGDVVLLAIPLGGITSVASRIGEFLSDKVVIDAMNPFPQRDGEVAADIRRRRIPSGLALQRRLAQARVVRAFSSLPSRDLQTEAHREHDPVAVPFAGDDPAAKNVVAQLIRDAGFEPYDIGSLAESMPLDPGGMLFGKALTRNRIDHKLERVADETAAM